VFGASQEWIRALVLGRDLRASRAEIGRVTAADVQKLARAILARSSTRWVISGDRSAATRAVQAIAIGECIACWPGAERYGW
jgi:hypothetical protein